MLESWSHYIFIKIKSKLQESAMGLVLSERNGEAFEKQLVIGVRESYGEYLSERMLCLLLVLQVEGYIGQGL